MKIDRIDHLVLTVKDIDQTCRSIYFRDLDGNLIEVSTYHEKNSER